MGASSPPYFRKQDYPPPVYHFPPPAHPAHSLIFSDMNLKDLCSAYNKKYRSASPETVLADLASVADNGMTFSSSFGLEDQVITDMIFSAGLQVEIFTLDTGRLFPETYSTLQATIARYGKQVKVYYPDTSMVEELVSRKGPLSFYESKENRLECCHIRKVVPLGRALKGKKIWITGLRAGQSENRKNLSLFMWDDVYSLIKYNPLLDWSQKDVKDYISLHHVPYNPLHDKGFPSIGCQPCTRAVKEGEDFRAGRWWWENNSSKECGLHRTEK